MSPKDADGVANSVVSDPGLHSLPKLMGDLLPTERREGRAEVEQEQVFLA